jgi:putative ABC transport system permease protein
MSALAKVVRAGVARRRVSTLVVVLATAAAVTSGILGAGLLVASRAPFEHLFARQHGAHLIVEVDPAKATVAQLAATANLDPVSAVAGPFLTAQVALAGPAAPRVDVVGRDQPQSPVDSVTLVEGRWARSANEIVLSAAGHILSPIGGRFSIEGTSEDLTVVGIARSASESATFWMTTEGVKTLNTPLTEQLLYRFDDASTTASVQKDRQAIEAALPSDAVTGARSWLVTKAEASRRTAVFVPFLLGFGLLALALAILVVGTVIAGTVASGIRRIGMLKAIGFAPAELVRAHAIQALIPALIGSGIGLVTGNLLSLPLLSDTERLVGDGITTIAIWVDVVVVLGILSVVTLVAVVAAARAGRLRTVDALAVGRTPSANRGRLVARLLARLPVSRPVGLGLARLFAVPSRTITLIAAVAIGCTAVTLASGLALSLNRIQVSAEHTSSDVTVEMAMTEMSGPPPTEEPAQPNAAGARSAIEATAGTSRWFGETQQDVTIAGLSGGAQMVSFTSNPSWAGYDLISGRWFTGPDEAVLSGELLTLTGHSVGDTLKVGEKTFTIVGEAFDPNDDGRRLLTQTSSDASTTWQIEVKDGTSIPAYLDTLNKALEPYNLEAAKSGAEVDELVIIVDTLASLLTILMIAVAGLGVLNTVTLDVRDRVHDIGVQKALGMTPAQTLTAVIASVLPIGLVGALIGVPAGLALHRILVPAMAHGAGTDLPHVLLEVYTPTLIIAIALAGPALAVISAMPAASWAARVRTATALRTE